MGITHRLWLGSRFGNIDMAINTPKHVWNEESNGILNAMYLVMLSEDMPSETENSWKSESLLILGLQQFHTFDIGYSWMERLRFNDSHITYK